MADQRLPIVNDDDGIWGDILRQYLKKEHTDNGTDNAANGGHQHITITASDGTAGTAPITFTAGTNLSSPVSGAMEYDGTYYYLTPSSAARKKIALYDAAGGATGDIYYRNSSGYFAPLSIGSTGDILTIASGIPSWTASIVGKALGNTNTVTLKDANFTLQDDGDATKQARFQLGGITAGTTRTYAVPDADTTLVGTDTSQTLANKIYTAPLVDGDITQSGTRPFFISNNTSTPGFAGGLKWQQSGSSKLELFYDTTSHVLNYWNTDGTDTGAHMTYNREGYMYVGSGSGVDMSSRLKIYDNHSTATSGDVKGLMSEVYLDPSGSASTRAWGVHFVGATKTGNAQDLTGGDAIQGFEGKAQHNGTGTVTGANGGLLYIENSSTGTITNARTLNLFPMANGNGGTVTNATHIVTNGLPIFSANNQSRIAIDIAASTPDPGSYTGTTAAAIRLNGGNGVRDGILFSNDVTLYRSAANTLKTDDTLVVGTPGTASGSVATVDGSQTLSNKRIQPRSASTTSSATPSINSDSVDTYQITALATNITSIAVTGTPVVGQQLLISIKDDGSSRTIAWGSSFASSGLGTLPTTTATGKTHWIGVVWDGSKWACLAADAVGY